MFFARFFICRKEVIVFLNDFNLFFLITEVLNVFTVSNYWILAADGPKDTWTSKFNLLPAVPSHFYITLYRIYGPFMILSVKEVKSIHSKTRLIWLMKTYFF